MNPRGILRPVFLCSVVLAAGLSIPTSQQAKAQTNELAPVPARVTRAIDESQRVTLFGNTHPLAVGKYDRGPAPLSMPASRLLLVLRRSAQQEAMLETYLQSLQDSTSPNFRKWKTPEEFGAQFGVSDADLTAVQTWLQGQGFTINKVAKSRMAIEFSGTVGQVQTAFATSIHSYMVNGEQHWANATNPQIPAALEPVVAGLAELNNFVPKSQAIKGPMGTFVPETNRIEPEYTLGDTTNGYHVYLFPADAATIYNTPTSLNPGFSGTRYDGTGVTIGIAGDSNIDVTQNANFRTTFGLPANPTTVVVDGDDPGENGDALEAYLDTQVSGGIAPGAKVILYTAQNTYLNAGLFLGIVRALDDNRADILNVSFGACEAAQGTSGNQFIYNIWEQAAAQGISVTVSSGDSGSAGCDDPHTQTAAQQGLAVNGLASTPFNIAVGGTDFDVLYSNFPTSFTQYVDVTNTLANHRSALSYIPEEPWNNSTLPNTSILQNVPLSVASHYQSSDNIVGGGGGVSSCATSSSGACGSGYPLPTWQSGFGKDTTGRNLPDVSFLAGDGLYGAIWGLCTDLEFYVSNGQPAPNCVPPTTGNNFVVTGVGGTSAAAPAFAGMLALAEQKAGSRLGQADYTLYKLAKTKYSSVFHDVTTGDNSVECVNGSPGCQAVNMVNTYYLSGYNAATGYDEATGLGSVDANQMVSNWGSVALAATNSSLTLNGGTAALSLTHGAAVTVKATVAGSGGTPAGDVALVDNIDPATLPNNDSIGFFTLASGTAEGTTNFLPGGSYNMSAHYGGSSTFAASDSNSIAVTVSPESSSTSLKVVGYFDPVTGQPGTTPYYGLIYLLDAQPYGNSASSANPNGAATGAITFKSGTTTLGSAPLASNGVAELHTAKLVGGSNSLTASFPGDASFNASTSAAVSFNVVPAVTTLQETASTNNSNVTDPVTFTVKFVNLDSDGAAPTGTVTFSDNTSDGVTTLATVPVTGTAGTSTALATASATLTTTKLAIGNNAVSATYNGDANYAGSSDLYGAVVTVTGATTKMTSTTSATTFNADQPLQVNVKLPASGTFPTPTGTVTITVNSLGYVVYTAPAVPVTNGSITYTIPANSLPLGPQTLFASYSGDSYYADNTTWTDISVFSDTVAAPVFKISPTSPTGDASQPIDFTVSVGGSTATASGTVTIWIPGFQWTSTLNAGTASFTIPANTLPAGTYPFNVNYSGDTNYIAANTSVTVIITAPDVAVTGTNVTLAAGATTGNTSTITVTPSGGFTGAVTLTASITAGPTAAHDPPTLGFGSTTPLNITAGNAGTATLTVTTTASTSSCNASLESGPRAPWLAGGGTALAFVVLFGIPARRRKWRTMLGGVALLIAMAGGVAACGGGGGGSKACTVTSVAGTTPGVYTATVTATAGTITKTATVTITVN